MLQILNSNTPLLEQIRTLKVAIKNLGTHATDECQLELMTKANVEILESEIYASPQMQPTGSLKQSFAMKPLTKRIDRKQAESVTHSELPVDDHATMTS